jgi:hypothetical protein
VRATVRGCEPLDAQNRHQHADEQKLAPGAHISKQFSPHSKARRFQFIKQSVTVLGGNICGCKVDNDAN